IIGTGGSSGYRKGMATRFVEEGHQVGITGRSEEKLATVKDELTELSKGTVHTVSMDGCNIEDIDRVVEERVETFGTTDGLVNRASGNLVVAAEDLSYNGWNSVIDIVLNGTFYCSQAVCKYWMKEGIKGKILNMVATYAWDAGAGV